VNRTLYQCSCSANAGCPAAKRDSQTSLVNCADFDTRAACASGLGDLKRDLAAIGSRSNGFAHAVDLQRYGGAGLGRN
jgi:hypothetical protein